jgi:hypothetical protein
MTNQSQWYYSQGGAQAGPVPVAGLRDMVASGQLTHDDLVWSEGMSSWLAIRQVPALQAMFASTPGAGPGSGGASAPPVSPLDALAGAQQQQQYAPAAGYGVQYGTPNYGYQQQMAPSSNGLAIAALICTFVAQPVGLILAIVALSQMKRSGNLEGKGLAQAALIVSICQLVLVCVIVVILVIVGIAASQH